MKIGGNVQSIIQITSEGIQNEIGEDVVGWVTKKTVTGWLDLSTGEANHINFNAKIQESTHIFICDWFDLEGISAENARMLIGGKIYEIKLIDNPMEMNQHFEIYLKFIGGQ